MAFELLLHLEHELVLDLGGDHLGDRLSLVRQLREGVQLDGVRGQLEFRHHRPGRRGQSGAHIVPVQRSLPADEATVGKFSTKVVLIVPGDYPKLVSSARFCGTVAVKFDHGC